MLAQRGENEMDGKLPFARLRLSRTVALSHLDCSACTGSIRLLEHPESPPQQQPDWLSMLHVSVNTSIVASIQSEKEPACSTLRRD